MADDTNNKSGPWMSFETWQITKPFMKGYRMLLSLLLSVSVIFPSSKGLFKNSCIVFIFLLLPKYGKQTIQPPMRWCYQTGITEMAGKHTFTENVSYYLALWNDGFLVFKHNARQTQRCLKGCLHVAYSDSCTTKTFDVEKYATFMRSFAVGHFLWQWQAIWIFLCLFLVLVDIDK